MLAYLFNSFDSKEVKNLSNNRSEREKTILAATEAATYKPDYVSNDRLEAATQGHGVLPIAAWSVGNSIADSIINKGLNAKLKDIDKKELSLDLIVERAVDAAKQAGASDGNAALLSAAITYFASTEAGTEDIGSSARAGVPMANRKIGAIARMKAGASRTGAMALQTNKFTNRLTAFPAYKAIYEKLVNKELTSVDGADLPPFVSGGSIMGHSKLGEDIMVPEVAQNAMEAGVEAMKSAFEGTGVMASPLWCSLISAAVTNEVLHPDSFVDEEYGPFGVADSPLMIGKGGVEAAGLPETLHIRGTGEEFKTARIIGDFGTLLKDIGGPSTIGSMALNELFASFKESADILAGFSGGPVNPPLGHVNADLVPILRSLVNNGGDVEEAAEMVKEYKLNSFIDPEMALCSLNTMTRKAEQVMRGPVTEAAVLASEGVKQRAVYRRSKKVYEGLESGQDLSDVAGEISDERKAYVEERGSKILSGFTGKDISLEFTKLEAQARRNDPFTAAFWGFDSLISYDVEVEGKEYHIEDLSATEVPKLALEGKNADDPLYGLAIMAGAVLAQELAYIGHTVINMTVPAAVSAARGADPEDAAEEASKGAYLTRAIPGGKENAEMVARKSKELYSNLDAEEHDILPDIKTKKQEGTSEQSLGM